MDNCTVVTTAKHKTAWKHGPANVVLLRAVYSWMKLFISKVMTQMCAKSNLAYAFVTINGEHMTSGQVTRALQATWKKADLGDKITCTLEQKIAVSAVCRLQSVLRRPTVAVISSARENIGVQQNIVFSSHGPQATRLISPLRNFDDVTALECSVAM